MLRFTSDMASQSPRRVIWTARDDAIATFLFRTPLTPDLLFYASRSFSEPFASLDRTQRRLNDLVQAGWVFRSPLAIASQLGPRTYYQLTLDGYRMWRRDPTLAPPTKRFFAPRSAALHQHLYAKAQFLSHLAIAADRRGFTIENDGPENTVPVVAGEVTIWPDHFCTLVGPFGRRFPLFFEFDRSTETLESSRGSQNTWKERNAVYDAFQTRIGSAKRFRVVVVTTESRDRLSNILALFGRQTKLFNRQLLVGVYLPDFLAEDDALCHPLFADHRRNYVPLIPSYAVALPPRATKSAVRWRSRLPTTAAPYDCLEAMRLIGWRSRRRLHAATV